MNPEKSLHRISNLISQVSPKHEDRPVLALRAFRTIHTGNEIDPDSSKFEYKSPIILDIRKDHQNKDKAYPYTTHLIIEHIFHVSRLLESRNIHLKYVENGDTFIMFRTKSGLVQYSTINNKHWIKYLLVHATGTEDPEKIGEGEFRLEMITDKDGRLEYSVNIVYIAGGIKLTLAPVS